MNKPTGGTRNFSSKPSTLKKRRKEFDNVLSKGDYIESYFDKSGGYYVMHKNHNKIVHIGELGEGNRDDNREDYAAKILASKGYRIYMMGEKSYIDKVKKSDGFGEHSVIDFKTINNTGSRTIDKALVKAREQNADVVVLIQNTPKMDRHYVDEQIQRYTDRTSESERGSLKYVWVVGLSGRVHRRKI